MLECVKHEFNYSFLSEKTEIFNISEGSQRRFKILKSESPKNREKR